MYIEHPDPTLKYPHAVREEKTLRVLDWLLEFRLSSRELLTTRLGMQPKPSYKFLDALVAEGLLQAFKSVPANHARCFLLARPGAILLDEAGRDISHAHTSLAGVTRDAEIVHHLAVQAAVLRRLPQCHEVIWKHHIILPESLEKPDVLLRSPTGVGVALDYERLRKDDSRIYITFRNHAKALMHQHYQGVVLLFDRQAHYEHYRTLFDAETWPEYDYNRKKGQITALPTTFTPDTVPKLRQCFVFMLEDAVTPALIEARPPETADPAPHEPRAAARDEDEDEGS